MEFQFGTTWVPGTSYTKSWISVELVCIQVMNTAPGSVPKSFMSVHKQVVVVVVVVVFKETSTYIPLHQGNVLLMISSLRFQLFQRHSLSKSSSNQAEKEFRILEGFEVGKLWGLWQGSIKTLFVLFGHKRQPMIFRVQKSLHHSALLPIVFSAICRSRVAIVRVSTLVAKHVRRHPIT